MAQYPNFYENLEEAYRRLRDTVVVYDGEPYYVLCICDHKDDGIFRVYLDPLMREGGMAMQNYSIPVNWHDEGPGKSRGDKMDQFLEKNPESGVLRKMMNSPKFNRFRPFPLGMANIDGNVVYVERQPIRRGSQGLTEMMINQKLMVAPGADGRRVSYRTVELPSRELGWVIKGDYPDAAECVEALNDPDCTNTGAAFDRRFAFIRGPSNLLFFAYKADVIGVLPTNSLDLVRINPEFNYTKEVVDGLGIFKEIYCADQA